VESAQTLEQTKSLGQPCLIKLLSLPSDNMQMQDDDDKRNESPLKNLENLEWTRREFLTQAISVIQWLIGGKKR